MPIAQDIQTDIKDDYDILAQAYAEKTEESDSYFKALADAKAKLAAIKKPSKWSGTVGATALLNPSDQEYGVGLTMGVGYDSWSLILGADYYIPTGFSLSGFDLKDLDYRAGLQFTF